MDELFEIISHMPPEEALSEITNVLGKLLQDLDHDARERFGNDPLWGNATKKKDQK